MSEFISPAKPARGKRGALDAALARLNPNQREAVLHGTGPLLVLAGAGSGKTSTMSVRIAHLVAARNLPATDVLGLSFTNKAARELKDRVGRLIAEVSGPQAARGLTITTFHSLCVRFLREHADQIGYQKSFTIVDQSDQREVLREIFRNLRIDDRKFDLDTVLFEIGQAKSRFLTPEAAESHFLEGRRLSPDYALAAASSYGRYQEKLRLLNAMDFDDLLFNGVRLLECRDAVRAHFNARFRHILVDEYQDTNPTQFRLLRLLTERQQNLCVVGDDDQSIYSWRGADAAHILEFSRHYPGARTITLDQNYRSTTSILDAANQVIRNNRSRHPKSLWSDRGAGAPLTEVIVEEDRAEAEFVAQEIQRRGQESVAGSIRQLRPWKDFAILYRSNAQSRIFEEALRRYRVPYKIVGGMSFLDRKEVKDTLGYWRLIVNPSDDASLRRVLNWPARGIGKGSVEALGTYAFEQGTSFFTALSEAPRLAPRGAAGAIALRDLVTSLRAELEATALDPAAVGAWARRSLDRIGVKRAIEAEEDDPVQIARRWENVEELVHSLGQLRTEELEHAENTANGLALLQELIARMTLAAQDEEEDEDEGPKDEVTLLTLHGAKGLEYPIVFLVGMEEGFLPHKRTIEEGTDLSEERRLAYVGITRARDFLVFTRARNRVRYGKPVPRYRSRFLEEIPPDTLLRRDESAGPDATDGDAARDAHEAKVKNYLAGIREQLTRSPT